jgi:hypothetical protein
VGDPVAEAPVGKVNETTQENKEPLVIDLKNPWIVGGLAWLVPGLGHYYQGRLFKAILFAACIIPTFLLGMCLGSSQEIGFARNVYCSWREGDKRWFFIPQFCVGSVAIPAIAQSYLVDDGKTPFWNGAMSPPVLPGYSKNRHLQGRPTLDDIILKLGGKFELGTLFTVVAGLMNLLVLFDAIDGPILSRKETQEESQENLNSESSETA